MFGSKKAIAFSNNHTLISRSARITGDLYFSGDLQIEGKVCGNITAEPGQEARLVVAESGRVEGEIHAPVAVINGHVEGDIHSTKHIELAAKAVVIGTVHYHLLEMVKGSQVNGNLVYIGGGEAPLARLPASAPISENESESAPQ
jgi:cytoskeletal protein CcmA (bactofilin family)